MNLIPKLAEMLGVEIGEEFLLKAPFPNSGDITIDSPYRFRERLELKISEDEWKTSNYALEQLILGNFEIVKLPFEPKDGEMYYTVAWDREKIWCPDATWHEYGEHYCRKYCGNVFRTKKEAEAHKYEIYEKLAGKKWGGEQ